MFDSHKRQIISQISKQKQIFKNIFINNDKINTDDIKIDTLRGTATATAWGRLARSCDVTFKQFYKTSNNQRELLYAIKEVGIYFKIYKVRNTAESFNFVIFNISQNYKLNKIQQKKHDKVVKYLLTHSSFSMSSVDMCLDMPKSDILTPTIEKTRQYKRTAYYHADGVKLCVYDKFEKNPRKANYDLMRYEITLKFSKNEPILTDSNASQKAIYKAKSKNLSYTNKMPKLKSHKNITKKNFIAYCQTIKNQSILKNIYHKIKSICKNVIYDLKKIIC